MSDFEERDRELSEQYTEISELKGKLDEARAEISDLENELQSAQEEVANADSKAEATESLVLNLKEHVIRYRESFTFPNIDREAEIQAILDLVESQD